MTTPPPTQSECRNCGQPLTEESGWGEMVNCYCFRTPCIAALFREVRGLAYAIQLAGQEVH